MSTLCNNLERRGFHGVEWWRGAGRVEGVCKHAVSAALPSTYQNLLKFLEVWRGCYRDRNARCFLRHGVVKFVILYILYIFYSSLFCYYVYLWWIKLINALHKCFIALYANLTVQGDMLWNRSVCVSTVSMRLLTESTVTPQKVSAAALMIT